MIRVGFAPVDGKHWTGGFHYLKNLLTALSLYRPRYIVPVVLCGVDVPNEVASALAAIPGVEIQRLSAPVFASRGWRLAQALTMGRDPLLYSLVARFHLDAVFESAEFYGWRLGVAAISWIPDFQHRVLRDHFSFAGYWRREIGFRVQISARRTVMFSSQDCINFCLQHYRVSPDRLTLVRFAVPTARIPDPVTSRAVADRYGLPSHFFYMPNQFWRHKNHLLVLDALALLKKQGAPIMVVASGKQSDLRHPDHFAEVQAKIARLRLTNQVRLLGLIPYDDVVSLMCASIAVLNPSLSEGWSTSVEEARALGVPMLLSDLDVHREQAGCKATYFDRYSAQSLADALRQFEAPSDTVRQQMAVAAHVDSQERVLQFAADFEAAVRQAVAFASRRG